MQPIQTKKYHQSPNPYLILIKLYILGYTQNERKPLIIHAREK